MKYDHQNRKWLDVPHLESLCREARAKAPGFSDEDLFRSLLVRIRKDLGSSDPGEGMLPFGSTRTEALWGNILHHFNHQYDFQMDLKISEIINRELLHKDVSPSEASNQ